jgi:hypothetical protein
MSTLVSSCTRFAIKQTNQNQLVLYVLQIVKHSMQIQCFVFEDILGQVPREFSGLQTPESVLGCDFERLVDLLNSSKEKCEECTYFDFDRRSFVTESIKSKQAKIGVLVSNQLALTTSFKPQSFSYDFHLSTILR